MHLLMVRISRCINCNENIGILCSMLVWNSIVDFGSKSILCYIDLTSKLRYFMDDFRSKLGCQCLCYIDIAPSPINGYTECTRGQTFKSPPHMHAYLRNAFKFWKTSKHVITILNNDLFWLEKSFDWGFATGCNLKISNEKMGLVTYCWKDLFMTRTLVKKKKRSLDLRLLLKDIQCASEVTCSNPSSLVYLRK